MKTILLIEDDVEIRENTTEVLEVSNYKVISAENGKTGVDLAKKTKPDMIVCDIMMPELDGFGVLEALSKNPATAVIPFIFLTAKAERSDYRKGMNLGADDYLTKPFKRTELIEAIKTRFKKSEILKKEFKNNIDGLNEFFDHARGLEELSNLSSSRKTKTYKKKENIFMEGFDPKSLLFVINGKVKTYKLSENGGEYITGLHKEGDFLGYATLLEESAYQESAAAVEETEICFIPRQDFFSLMYSNRDVSHKFIKLLSKNVLEKEEQLLNLSSMDARSRIIALFKNMAKKEGEKIGYEILVKHSLTHQEIADLTATSRQVVTTTLNELKKDNLIHYDRKGILFRDIDKLN